MVYTRGLSKANGKEDFYEQRKRDQDTQGNIGSGFGNQDSRCGFPVDYYPFHKPKGFPNCANYKGTQEERIKDLRNRGAGSDQIDGWNDWYAKGSDMGVFGMSGYNPNTPLPKPEPKPEKIYNFVIESDGKVRVIRLAGSKAGEETRLEPQMAEININAGLVRPVTPQDDIRASKPDSVFSSFDNNAQTESYHTMPDGSIMKNSDMPKETSFELPSLSLPIAEAFSQSQELNKITVPESATIGFTGITENSVLVYWNPHRDGGSAITGYRLVIKNQDTGQTITELNASYNTKSTLIQNLDSGTNYRAYVIVINAIGNSFEQSNNFKTLGVKVETVKIIISSQVQTILNKFNNNDYTYPSWFNSNITFVTSGQITSNEFLNSFNGLLETDVIVDNTITLEKTFCVNVYAIRDSGSVYSTSYPKITAAKVAELEKTQFVLSCEASTVPTQKQVQDFYGFTPVPTEIDIKINSTMVSQSIGAFILKDGRITGEVLYIANQSFNSFYYNKPITSLVQIKSKSGVVIAIKSNNLNFTETERDERITIDESAGNFKELLIDFFVWDSPTSQLIFSETKQIQIVDETDVAPADPFDPKPPTTTCPAGYHKDFSGKCVSDDPVGEIPKDRLIETLKGFLFGTVALSLLARKY